jgi:hypothetical protein
MAGPEQASDPRHGIRNRKRKGADIMRTLMGALIGVILGCVAFTGCAMANGHVATVDPTVSLPRALTAADARADGWAVDCGHWGQFYGSVTIHGARTFEARGCVNPSGLGKGDSFGNDRLAALLASATK